MKTTKQTAVDESIDQLKIVLIETTWLTSCGWGNGYVCLPIGHPLYGKDHSEINVKVHGGLTFSGLAKEFDYYAFHNKHINPNWWVLGFDTMHYGDTKRRWSKKAVLAETIKLRDQLK